MMKIYEVALTDGDSIYEAKFFSTREKADEYVVKHQSRFVHRFEYIVLERIVDEEEV